jgi:hypothetical protein
MKGQVYTKELDVLFADAAGDEYSLEIETYGLPSIDSQRALVIIRHLQ